MGTIQLQTSVPGPKSKALAARREAAVPRGLGHALPIYVAKTEGATLEVVLLRGSPVGIVHCLLHDERACTIRSGLCIGEKDSREFLARPWTVT